MGKVRGTGPGSQPQPVGGPTETSRNTQTSESPQAENQAQQSQEQARSAEQLARDTWKERTLQSSVRQTDMRASIGQPSDVDGTERATRGPEAQHTVDVTRDPAFQALPEATRTRLQGEITNDPATSQRLQQVTNHRLYNEMSTEQRTQLLNVFANTEPAGRGHLVTLMNREVVVGSGNPPPTRPALLTGDNTRQQTTLLENLDRMATQPMAPEFENRRGELLGRVISETARPTWQVNQGTTGTCASTSVQQHLLQNTPSEYARIIGGLSGPERSVTLANGTRMDAALNQDGNSITTGTPPRTHPDNRSVTERMFQSAVQQHGDRLNDPNARFDANTDNTGMWDRETAHVMSAIQNRPYSYFPPTQSGGIDDATNNPQERANMRSELLNNIQRDVESQRGPIPAHLNWGTPQPDGTPSGRHEVLVERIENGRVYFRNPWGSSHPSAQGSEYSDGMKISGPPPRTVEDSQGGIESMTTEDFRQHLNGATIGPPVGGA